MTQTAQTAITPLNRARSPSPAWRARSERELIGWAWLAVGALAVAGVFAILLALSRIPGMEKTPFWPIDFFYKGLVIHVVFSLVIWLQGVFAFLVSVATLKLARRRRARRAARADRAGRGSRWLFPACSRRLSLRPRSPSSPITFRSFAIRPMTSDCLVLALGVLAPVVRLLVNLPGRLKSAPPLAVAMALGGFVYVLALICFGVAGNAARATKGSWRRAMNCSGAAATCCNSSTPALMVTNWSILARMSLGEEAVDNRVFLASRCPHRADRDRGAGVLRDFRSLLRPSARGVSGCCSSGSPRRR